MLNLSNLPDPIDPSFFYLYELGVCWQLKTFSVIFFSSLNWHGGSAPTYSKGFIPPFSVARVNIVCYPSSSLVDGRSLLAFAAMSGHSNLFTMRPEMTHVESVMFLFDT